jgi:hypothetical protein
MDHSDTLDSLRLLCARAERPSLKHSARNQCDELAPSHVFLSARGLQPTTPVLEMPRCASR